MNSATIDTLSKNDTESNDIAIIGLAGRFPKAVDLESFWQLLKNGREGILEFTDAELLAAGVSPDLLKQPNYVKMGTVIPEAECFDATFFEMSAKDAEITDPQQRVFMETVWQALEGAGYPPSTTDARIGLYAGVGDNSYLEYCLKPNMQELLSTVGAYRLFTLSGKDFTATRTAYKLNLTGPAMSIQTACSTSLVAVHVACQSLLNMECDLALAGGASMNFPQQQGYLYQEGMIMSADGHCRSFDAKADGTAAGGGVGVVLLKRLNEALEDGDTIHAVIKGSAVNNDGSDKIGYTAPSISGQTDVIAEAQAVAGIHPEDIGYIEAHGTATPLGDPIEIQALMTAFRAHTNAKRYCAIGSVKSNIGHADAAAGIAGLIKTVLALKHRQIPPSLHFAQPNPQIDFANSPFFVNAQLRDWETTDNKPRCAGVSSFGIGGTNAHVILAEAPAISSSSSSRALQLITLSAKTNTALEASTANLTTWLSNQKELSLADVAYTLNKGRQSFAYRKTFVCTDVNHAVQQLPNLPGYLATEKARGVVFLFPGQGSQYLGMTHELYQTEVVFKEYLDQCAAILKPCLGQNLLDLLFGDDSVKLKQTVMTQPALFAVEYALAKLWMAFGIQPKAMLGHSIGEYVAACLAGVFSLEDALRLVVIRGQLIQSLPGGAMLAVPLSEADVQQWLTPQLSLAAVNGDKRCVISGTSLDIETLQQKLQTQGIESRPLHTSHAFHSHMMDPILTTFATKVGEITLHPPVLPYLSNLTGTWIKSEQAIDPNYWVSHLRNTVRFADNLKILFQQEADVFLEVGPRQTLSSLARQHPLYSQRFTVLASLPKQYDYQNSAETSQILLSLGQLWANNVAVNWDAFYAGEKRHRLPLPTYPFERKKYWIDAPAVTVRQAQENSRENWLYQPHWSKTTLPVMPLASTAKHWLLFEDNEGVSQQLKQRLLEQGHTVSTVQMGTVFKQCDANSYVVDPQASSDYEALVQALAKVDFPTHVVHLWSVTKTEDNSVFKQTELALQKGFYSLLYLTQALAKGNFYIPLDIAVVSNQMQKVMDSDLIRPEKAALLGAIKTIGLDMNSVRCYSIDITLPFNNETLRNLWLELLNPIDDIVIAYRHGQRWTESYVNLPWEAPVPVDCLRQQGVYLITGGLGGIGLCLSKYLAQRVQAKLILTGRSVFPEKVAWQDWLSQHDENNAVSKQIVQLQELEKDGAEVLVYQADVTDIIQMRHAIESAQQHFGLINGVIHAAGIASSFTENQRGGLTPAQVLAPKVTGTLILKQLLSNQTLDLFIFCSSLSSIVGLSGQMAYSGANAFQDAFAQANNHYSQTLFTAINWDGWQKVGMAIKATGNSSSMTADYKKIQFDPSIPGFQEELQEFLQRFATKKSLPLSLSKYSVTEVNLSAKQTLTHGLLPEEGVEVFKQVLAHHKPQVLVVKQGLLSLLTEIKSMFDIPMTEGKISVESKSTRPILAQPYIAPITSFEIKLVEIWQTFLGIEAIGIEDDFFDLGGDSLLAVQLAAYLRTELQVNLGTQALLSASTIAKLAILLTPTETSIPESTNELELLVKIKEGDPLRPALVMIHPVGGYVYFYRELAQLLSNEQAVYAIEAQGVDGKTEPLFQVEKMARQYIQQLQKHQPKGPYLLGGSSFGGMIAYEMAQQLTEQGEEIALLALIDTPGPEHMPTGIINDDADVMAYVLEVGRNIKISAEELRAMNEQDRWQWFVEKTDAGDTESGQSQSQIFMDLFRANTQAMFAYQPQAWAGKAVFFRAMEKDAHNAKTPEKAWGNLVLGGMDIYDIPGNHITMNELPHVLFLAEQLQYCIDSSL